jgi:long-chain acyl-CoA synthetase
LAEHPGVALAGVVGIHEALHGENVRAYVTVKAGEPVPTSRELIEFARTRVGYKAPEEIVFLGEMPLNPTGKVDRVALKRLAEDHLHPHGIS